MPLTKEANRSTIGTHSSHPTQREISFLDTDMIIRTACQKDAATCAAIYSPIVRETAISFELEPPNEQEMLARITKSFPMFPWLVCELDGIVVGYAYARQFRDRPAYQWSVEVSVYVAAEARGKGVGRALYVALFEILQRQRFINVIAGITLPNDASVRLHESMGFQPIGVFQKIGYKFGAWHDVGFWRLTLGEHSRDPLPPISFADLRV